MFPYRFSSPWLALHWQIIQHNFRKIDADLHAGADRWACYKVRQDIAAACSVMRTTLPSWDSPFLPITHPWLTLKWIVGVLLQKSFVVQGSWGLLVAQRPQYIDWRLYRGRKATPTSPALTRSDQTLRCRVVEGLQVRQGWSRMQSDYSFFGKMAKFLGNRLRLILDCLCMTKSSLSAALTVLKPDYAFCSKYSSWRCVNETLDI